MVLPNKEYPAYSLSFLSQDSGLVSSIGQEDDMWQDEMWLWKQRNKDFISQNQQATSDGFLNYQKEYLQSQTEKQGEKMQTISSLRTTLCPSELKPSAEAKFLLNVIGLPSLFFTKTDPDFAASVKFDSGAAQFYRVYDLGPEDFEGLSESLKEQKRLDNFKEKLGCGLPIEFTIKMTSIHTYLGKSLTHDVRENFQNEIPMETRILIEASGQDMSDFFVPEEEFFWGVETLEKEGAESPFYIGEQISITLAKTYEGEITVEAIDGIAVLSSDGGEYSTESNGKAKVLFEDPLIGLILYNEMYIKALEQAMDLDRAMKNRMEEVKANTYKDIIPFLPGETKINFEGESSSKEQGIQSTLNSLKMCCEKDIELEGAFCNPEFKRSTLSGNLGAKIDIAKVILPYDKIAWLIDEEVGYKFDIGGAPCEVVSIQGEKAVQCALYPNDEDAYFLVDISLSGINWPEEITEDNKLSCGNPDKVKIDFDLGGIYYNRYDIWTIKIPKPIVGGYWETNISIDKLNQNIFLKAREKALNIINLISILKNSEWKDSQGNQISSPFIEDSLEKFFNISEEEKGKGDKDVNEKLSLTLEKVNGEIKSTIEDTINFDEKTIKQTSSAIIKLRQEPIPEGMIEIIFKGIAVGLSQSLYEASEKIKFKGEPEEFDIEIPVLLFKKILFRVLSQISEKGEPDMKEIKGYSWNAVECCKPKEESEKSENKITTSSTGESVYILRDSTNFMEEGIAYQINFDEETYMGIEKTFYKPSVLFGNWENYEIYKYPDEYIDLFCNYEVLEENTFSVNREAGTYSLDSFEVSVPENAFDSTQLTIKKLALVNCNTEIAFMEDYKQTPNIEFLLESLKAFINGQVTLKEILQIISELRS